MARPVNKGLRSAILSVFDAKPVVTVKDVYKELTKPNSTDVQTNQISEQSARRMMSKMVKEGLITEIPKRGDKNQVFFTKAVFKNTTRFTSYDGSNVSLKEFIHTLTDDVKPELIDSNAMSVIKVWMLDSMAASIPVAYSSKNREVPNRDALKEKLEATLSMTRKFHAFLKSFVDSDVWDESAIERLAKEFNSTCVEEHAFIVDKAWLENEQP